MDIKTDSEIEKQLVNKLLELGFSKSSLSSEVKTPYGKYIDLVALEFDKPKIVFEVKSKVMLQPALNTEGNGFRFHPAVRQAQLLAQEIKAPYFAVYDGEDLLWFEVDENDGSPKLLEKPVLPISESKTDRENNKTQILNLLFALADLGRGQFTREKYLTLVGLAILAKFWSEMGNPILEKILSTDKLDIQSIENDIFEHTIIENNKNKDYFAVAFSLLSNTSLSNVSSENLIAALDDYIQFNVNQFNLGEFRLSTWISEFTTSLAIVNSPKSVLDIYSNFGDSVVAAYKANKETRVFSVSSVETSYIYDKLKRAILGLNVKDVVYLPQYVENKNVWLEKKFQKKFSCVIITPPFGARVIGSERQKFQRSEELFLDLSLQLTESNGRVICVVPESLLVSSRSNNFREYLREFAWVNSIISLEQFLPSSSAMVSLLILNKKSPNTKQGNILMGRITSKDIGNLPVSNKSIHTNNYMQKILDIYKAHTNHDAPQNQKRVWFIPEEQLDNKSWGVDFYNPDTQVDINSEFPLLPLNELAYLRKGSPLTLNENGALPVIGPGALRSFFIDPAKLDKTSIQNIPPNQVIAQVNDVLIHAVGTYFGEAALVDPDFENFFISRNIIVVRDISPKILPAYLVIALNSGFVKQQLQDRTTGSVMKLLSVKKLNDLKIPVPDILMQRNIIDKVFSAREKLLEIEEQALMVQSSLKERQNRLRNILDNIHLGGGENA